MVYWPAFFPEFSKVSLCVTAGGDVHSVPFVELVHGFHQLSVITLCHRRCKQQIALHLGGGCSQVQQHPPGLG